MTHIVMIFLDAFSSKYLNTNITPFIYEIAQKGYYTPLKPMFAFQGIGASIFSGTLPNTNKIWCDWILKNEINPLPKLFKYLSALSDLIPNDRLSKDFRYILYKIFNRDFGTPNTIPSNLLPFFELRFKKKYTEKNALGQIVTLFDQLENYNLKYYVSGLYDIYSEKRIVKNVLHALENNYNLSLIKLASLDTLGHKHGPKSQKLHKELREIDTHIKKIVDVTYKLNENVHFVIFSDHGMSPVTNYMNLPQILNKLPIKIGKDYLVFLDSTVARFWFYNEKARNLIFEKLSKLDCGQILNKSDLEKLGIDKIGYEYGELFFALKEGYVFFPDFFRRHNPPKGMHGYAHSSDSPILLLYSQKGDIHFKNKDNAQMIDIMPTVLELLDIPIPSTCEGISCIHKEI